MRIHPESISIYEDIKKSDYPLFKHKVKIRIQFDYSPKVTVDLGDYTVEPYDVYMKDSSGNVIYHTKVYSGYYSYSFRKWIDDVTVTVHDKFGEVVSSFNLYDKIRTGNVIISFDSSSLGDTIAWFPYVEKFREKHNCANLMVTTFWNKLFEPEYPEMTFKNPGYRGGDPDVVIGLGWYNEDDRNVHKKDPRTCNLQEVAADILGVEYVGDIRPRIFSKGLRSKPTDRKYVCIGTESIAAAKHWNYPDGWQSLVTLLRGAGYEVVLIHRQGNNLRGVIDKSGEIEIEDRISDLLQCEFFIGVSSGLSWLAWALDVPTVVISGFTHKFCEFSGSSLRIINESVCHGCFNDPNHKFDRGDWWWCPRHKNTERHFECTKSIDPLSVFNSIMDWTENQNKSS